MPPAVPSRADTSSGKLLRAAFGTKRIRFGRGFTPAVVDGGVFVPGYRRQGTKKLTGLLVDLVPDTDYRCRVQRDRVGLSTGGDEGAAVRSSATGVVRVDLALP